MRTTSSRRYVSIGSILYLAAMLGSAHAAEPSLAGATLTPEVASTAPEESDGKALKAAGIAMYVVGGLYDLYTTKRAMDYGLHEGNPLLNQSSDPAHVLATAAAVKIGVAFIVEGVGRRSGARKRGAWFLSCGALQIGIGLSNRSITIRQREANEPTPTAGLVAPAPADLTIAPIGPAGSPPPATSAPIGGDAASGWWRIGKRTTRD